MEIVLIFNLCSLDFSSQFFIVLELKRWVKLLTFFLISVNAVGNVVIIQDTLFDCVFAHMSWKVSDWPNLIYLSFHWGHLISEQNHHSILIFFREVFDICGQDRFNELKPSCQLFQSEFFDSLVLQWGHFLFFQFLLNCEASMNNLSNLSSSILLNHLSNLRQNCRSWLSFILRISHVMICDWRIQ